MKLSVIVPSFNAELTIRRCLDSLLRQNVADGYEILCVDDGSVDGTKDVLREYASMSPEIVRVITQEHAGVSAARNNGIRHAHGDVIAFCDSDDYLIDGAYGMLLHRFWDDETDVLTFRAVTVDQYAAKKIATFDRLEGEVIYRGSGWDYYQKLGYRTFCWNHLFRKSFLNEKEITFRDHIVCEDVLFCLDVHRMNPRILEVDSCVYRYMVNEGQTMARRNLLLMKRMVDDYMSLFQAFHDCGLRRYIDTEMIPMSSRMLSAALCKDSFLLIRGNLEAMGVLPMDGSDRKQQIINLIFRDYVVYQCACFLYRSIFVPLVLPRLHRNAGI